MRKYSVVHYNERDFIFSENIEESEIARGAFGVVYKAKYVGQDPAILKYCVDGYVVIKQSHKASSEKTQADYLAEEKEKQITEHMGQGVTASNGHIIMKPILCCRNENTKIAKDQSLDLNRLFMKLAENQLANDAPELQRFYNRSPDVFMARFINAMHKAYQHVEQRGIVHLDGAGRNIMMCMPVLNDSGEVCDFDVECVDWGQSVFENEAKPRREVGPLWIMPQKDILQAENRFDADSDQFAMRMTILSLLSGTTKMLRNAGGALLGEQTLAYLAGFNDNTVAAALNRNEIGDEQQLRNLIEVLHKLKQNNPTHDFPPQFDALQTILANYYQFITDCYADRNTAQNHLMQANDLMVMSALMTRGLLTITEPYVLIPEKFNDYSGDEYKRVMTDLQMLQGLDISPGVSQMLTDIVTTQYLEVSHLSGAMVQKFKAIGFSVTELSDLLIDLQNHPDANEEHMKLKNDHLVKGYLKKIGIDLSDLPVDKMTLPLNPQTYHKMLTDLATLSELDLTEDVQDALAHFRLVYTPSTENFHEDMLKNIGWLDQNGQPTSPISGETVASLSERNLTELNQMRSDLIARHSWVSENIQQLQTDVDIYHQILNQDSTDIQVIIEAGWTIHLRQINRLDSDGQTIPVLQADTRCQLPFMTSYELKDCEAQIRGVLSTLEQSQQGNPNLEVLKKVTEDIQSELTELVKLKAETSLRETGILTADNQIAHHDLSGVDGMDQKQLATEIQSLMLKIKNVNEFCQDGATSELRERALIAITEDLDVLIDAYWKQTISIHVDLETLIEADGFLRDIQSSYKLGADENQVYPDRVKSLLIGVDDQINALQFEIVNTAKREVTEIQENSKSYSKLTKRYQNPIELINQLDYLTLVSYQIDKGKLSRPDDLQPSIDILKATFPKYAKNYVKALLKDNKKVPALELLNTSQQQEMIEKLSVVTSLLSQHEYDREYLSKDHHAKLKSLHARLLARSFELADHNMDLLIEKWDKLNSNIHAQADENIQTALINRQTVAGNKVIQKFLDEMDIPEKLNPTEYQAILHQHDKLTKYACGQDNQLLTDARMRIQMGLLNHYLDQAVDMNDVEAVRQQKALITTLYTKKYGDYPQNFSVKCDGRLRAFNQVIFQDTVQHLDVRAMNIDQVDQAMSKLLYNYNYLSPHSLQSHQLFTDTKHALMARRFECRCQEYLNTDFANMAMLNTYANELHQQRSDTPVLSSEQEQRYQRATMHFITQRRSLSGQVDKAVITNVTPPLRAKIITSDEDYNDFLELEPKYIKTPRHAQDGLQEVTAGLKKIDSYLSDPNKGGKPGKDRKKLLKLQKAYQKQRTQICKKLLTSHLNSLRQQAATLKEYDNVSRYDLLYELKEWRQLDDVSTKQLMVINQLYKDLMIPMQDRSVGIRFEEKDTPVGKMTDVENFCWLLEELHKDKAIYSPEEFVKLDQVFSIQLEQACMESLTNISDIKFHRNYEALDKLQKAIPAEHRLVPMIELVRQRYSENTALYKIGQLYQLANDAISENASNPEAVISQYADKLNTLLTSNNLTNIGPELAEKRDISVTTTMQSVLNDVLLCYRTHQLPDDVDSLQALNQQFDQLWRDDLPDSAKAIIETARRDAKALFIENSLMSLDSFTDQDAAEKGGKRYADQLIRQFAEDNAMLDVKVDLEWLLYFEKRIQTIDSRADLTAYLEEATTFQQQTLDSERCAKLLEKAGDKLCSSFTEEIYSEAALTKGRYHALEREIDNVADLNINQQQINRIKTVKVDLNKAFLQFYQAKLPTIQSELAHEDNCDLGLFKKIADAINDIDLPNVPGVNAEDLATMKSTLLDKAIETLKQDLADKTPSEREKVVREFSHLAKSKGYDDAGLQRIQQAVKTEVVNKVVPSVAHREAYRQTLQNRAIPETESHTVKHGMNKGGN